MYRCRYSGYCNPAIAYVTALRHARGLQVGGHSRVVNTAYGLGDIANPAKLQGGVAQGFVSRTYLLFYSYVSLMPMNLNTTANR